MDFLPFVVEWTGREAVVGIYRYGLVFEPDATYPEGLHLVRAWLLGETLVALDPLKVPSQLVHPSRRVAAKWLANWGSRSNPPTSIFTYPKRHPIYYDPGRSPGQAETKAMLEAITSATQQPHR